MRLVVISLIFLRVAAAQSESSASAVFSKIRANVIAQLKKTSNYICVQTSERTTYIPDELVAQGCEHRIKHPDKRQEEMHDRLRLDVAVSGGNEIYEWHGAKQFTSESIDDIVQSGAVTSGGFNGFLLNIFTSRGVEIRRLSSTGSHELFGYRVPLTSSTYSTRVNQKFLPVTYHGSFSANAETLELESLSVIVDDFPQGSNICGASTSIQYQIAKIAQKELLIPKEFELHMMGDTHENSVSISRFSECHEYSGESTLKLDYVDENSLGSTAVPVRDVKLPPRLRFKVQLRQNIDSDTTFCGDPVQGVLSRPLKIAGTQTVIPAGSAVTGVITQLERYKIPKPYFILGLRFNRISAGDTIYEFSGTEDVGLDQLGTLNFVYGRHVPTAVLTRFNKKGQGTFAIVTNHLRLDTKYSVSLITQNEDQVKQDPQ